MIWADLHVHSTYSDGRLSVSELVDFYGSRGFDCIAITDHICERRSFLGLAAGALKFTLTEENFPEYLETVREAGERAWAQYRMVVLPGFELSKNSLLNSRSAHILGIGVSRWIPAEASIETMLDGLRSQGALTVAAHPVHTGAWEPQTLHLWDRREELRTAFDAWEVASGPRFFNEVKMSGLPMLATSDLHHPKQIRSWKTKLGVSCGERDPAAIIEAVRKQRVEFAFWDEAASLANGLFLSQPHRESLVGA